MNAPGGIGNRQTATREGRLRQRVWNNPTEATHPDVRTCMTAGTWWPASIINPHLSSFMWGLDLSGSLQEQACGRVAGDHRCRRVRTAYDGNGNVTALVEADGAGLTAQYEYGPFGELLRATGPMAKANPFRWSTQYTNDETDLVMYLHRPYSPSTGRFLSRDPIGESGGKNVYVFVHNNAISQIDAWGL